MSSRKKKILLKPFAHTRIIGFVGILLLIVLLPFALSLIKQSTENRSRATASTTLSFSSPTPAQVGVGQSFSMDVMITPGNNLVSFIKLIITYDNSIITPAATSIVPNPTVFSDPKDILDGPTNTCNGNQCTLTIQLSIGSNPTNALSQPTNIATITFVGVSTGSTQISFDPQTLTLSIAPSDAPSENVLSSSTPATITIGGSGSFTPSPTGVNPTPCTSCNGTPTPTIINPSGIPQPDSTDIMIVGGGR